MEYLFKNTNEIGGNPLFKSGMVRRMLARDVNATIARFVQTQSELRLRSAAENPGTIDADDATEIERQAEKMTDYMAKNGIQHSSRKRRRLSL